VLWQSLFQLRWQANPNCEVFPATQAHQTHILGLATGKSPEPADWKACTTHAVRFNFGVRNSLEPDHSDPIITLEALMTAQAGWPFFSFKCTSGR
jgi:hypothetical protein